MNYTKTQKEKTFTGVFQLKIQKNTKNQEKKFLGILKIYKKRKELLQREFLVKEQENTQPKLQKSKKDMLSFRFLQIL